MVARTETEQQLRSLVRLRERLVQQRVAIAHQLRAVIINLSPEISTSTWQGPKVTSATFLAVLARWPDLLSLSRAHHQTVARLAAEVGRYSKERALEIAICLKQWSVDLLRIQRSRLDGAMVEIRMTREILEMLDRHIRELERKLEVAVEAHPAGNRLQGIPGIGTLAAACLCSDAAPKARVMTEPQLATHSGLTPASRSSGKVQRSHLRRNVNKRLACIYFISSVAALKASKIDRIYYDKKRSDFHGHPAAHKKATIALARQRHKVVYKILGGEEYDQTRLATSTLIRAREQTSASRQQPPTNQPDCGS